ncbi:DUF4381 domain-containing protein (plasmid) [Rhizobium grahamii]|uniref:DUF4381 domain-containing protein n=2 Tax=Rhizobium TaxID=379 RepID=A0A5Q0CHX9_9HYPH|nr:MULTISPECIES: DUF4381 domain-containing protein [Rhizobium]QFY64081.1 DUF4381 domain-containing protein [Rhizobium grahamii]QRM53049.1 DUF4381 domain-containing protein [Rhizobium sp. BG6]
MEQEARPDPITEAALRSLKDIAVPQPVSWIPQTWGWMALALILLAAILLWALVLYRRWRRNAYRREALRLLDEIADDFRRQQTRDGAGARLGELLKRTALAAWPRKTIAAMSGTDWIDFLSANQGSDIGESLKSYLNDLEYRSGATPSADATNDLLRDARRWIERHHVSA